MTDNPIDPHFGKPYLDAEVTRPSPADLAAQKAVDRMIDFVWLAFGVGFSLGLVLGWLS